MILYLKDGNKIRKMLTAAGGPLRPTSYLDSFEPEWKKEYKKGIQRIPEITVTGKKRYVMSADPDHQTKFIGAMIGPFKNLLSPTQGARLVYDTGKALSGNMSFTDWSKSLMENNNGIVTDEFAKEHPYLSTGINLAGDIGVGGGALLSKTNLGQEAIARTKGVLDATKYGLYDRALGYNLYNKFLKGKTRDLHNLLEDIDLFSGENYIGNNLISDKSGRLFMLPTTYTRSELISSGPSIRMGFNANNGKLSRNLVNQGKEAIDKLPAGTSISADAHGLSVPSRLATEGNREGIIATLLRGTSDAETTLSNLEKKLGEDPGTFIRNPYDMSADAHRFFTLEAQKPGRQLVYAGRSGLWNNAAISNPQVYEWQEAYNAGNLSAREYVNNYNNWVKSFGGRPGHVDINGKPYFYHPTIFITHKQGGKMNVIEQFKNGSGIHIKKKNRGKFTSYCGGNVTSACIAKAKRSGNPTLVKRATFAANARKWKHLNGGNIWNRIDKYANYAEKAAAIGSLASMGASIAVPNPVTLGTAAAFNIGGGLIDGYLGIRAALNGDWVNASKNGMELLLSLFGAKSLSKASKLSELDRTLRLANAPRTYVTKTVGRRPANKHIYKTTKEANDASTASAAGWSLGIGANASSLGEWPTKNLKGGKLCLIKRS